MTVVYVAIVDIDKANDISERKPVRIVTAPEGLFIGEFIARCERSAERSGTAFYESPIGGIPASVRPWPETAVAGRTYGWKTLHIELMGLSG